MRKGRVLPQQEGYLDQARDQRERVCGYDIQTYHWKGSRDTVLLVHGWESNSYRWRHLIRHLQEHDFDIRAFDAPGHGLSSGRYFHVPLYSECLLHMVQKHRPSHVVAHSVGGMTALYAHYREPASSVEQIVTIGSPSEFQEIMEHYRRLLGLNPRVMQALDDYVKGRFGFRLQEFSASAFAQTLRQKGLLLHDIHDSVAPFHASRKIHERWRDSILVATEGLGHSMQQEAVNKRIVDFLISGK